jgi:hypothetical protein
MTDLDQVLGNGPGAEWIRAHLDYPHKDWCLLWPFSLDTNGYAQIGKEKRSVHRIFCWHRNGSAPSDEHHAAHSCGRGHDGCVNQWHLDWKTPSQNQDDRYQHSGLTPRSKLTPAQVDEIRALKGRATLADIATQFGVSPTNIWQIHAGKAWSSTAPRKRVFTAEEVQLIRRTPWREKSAAQFAKELGVHTSAIERIRQFKTYRYVEAEGQS